MIKLAFATFRFIQNKHRKPDKVLHNTKGELPKIKKNRTEYFQNITILSNYYNNNILYVFLQHKKCPRYTQAFKYYFDFFFLIIITAAMPMITAAAQTPMIIYVFEESFSSVESAG
jgi:hypothetical protein